MRLITGETSYVVCSECFQDTRHICEACNKALCRAHDCRRRHGYGCGQVIIADGAVPGEAWDDVTPTARPRMSSTGR
jgi:hypothetical protein